MNAFISLKPGFEAGEALARELLGHARKRLGSAIAPKEIAFAPNLPRTRSGKVMRARCAPASSAHPKAISRRSRTPCPRPDRMRSARSRPQPVTRAAARLRALMPPTRPPAEVPSARFYPREVEQSRQLPTLYFPQPLAGFEGSRPARGHARVAGQDRQMR